jgi:beta-aspartyl-dipeptidase (metallo-type)
LGVSLIEFFKALGDDGLTTFMWTGAYKFPPPTITGSVQMDIMMIDKIVRSVMISVFIWF